MDKISNAYVNLLDLFSFDAGVSVPAGRKNIRAISSRQEQYNRYFAHTGDHDAVDGPTLENTMEEDDASVQIEKGHRHYDSKAESSVPGSVYPSTASGVDSARRRRQARLAVSRTPTIEPIAGTREAFYEQDVVFFI